jgi:hypothetical protein
VVQAALGDVALYLASNQIGITLHSLRADPKRRDTVGHLNERISQEVTVDIVAFTINLDAQSPLM